MTDWSLDIIETAVLPDLPYSNYVPNASRDIRLDVPCFSFLLSNGSTHVLIDTGPDVLTSAGADLHVTGHPQDSFDATLESRSVDRTDIQFIIHTHLHYDHMLNDSYFPNAEVIVQRRELAWAHSDSAGPFYVAIDKFEREVADRLVLVDGDVEIVSGIMVVHNGGHTPGHQSVLASTANGVVCVCGDIVSLAVNREIVGAVCPDVTATRRFLDRARQARWELLPAHDPLLRSDPRYSSIL